MITLLELAERTQTGEKVEEKRWDIEFFKTISELVKKYKIEFPREHCFINMDDELVERAFGAAIEFLEEGLDYNPGAPDILAELGLVYFDANGNFGTRDMEKALEAFDAAMKTEGEPIRRIELLTYRSECHNALGRYEEAIAGLDKKIALMLEHEMKGSNRLRNAIDFRNKLYDKLYGSN